MDFTCSGKLEAQKNNNNNKKAFATVLASHLQ